jgi:hypothetical protein
MRRLLLVALALAALGVVAALLPTGHRRATLTLAKPIAPMARRPAWPLWAHAQAARAAAQPRVPSAAHAMNTAPQSLRSFRVGNAGLHDTAIAARLPHHNAQPLFLSVPALRGASTAVPTPPPRLA